VNRHSAARGGPDRAARPANLMRRRSAAVVLGIVGVAGLGIASAAQLNVKSGSLGAGTGVVASCQPAGTPITVSFTTAWAPTPTPAAYQASAISLSNVNGDCAGRKYRIRLMNISGVAIGSEISGPSLTLTGGVFTALITPNQPASSIASVAVVISS